MPDSDLDNIAPADFSVTKAKNPDNSSEAPAFGMGDSQYAIHAQQKNSKILWGIFGLLLVLVLGVIFILPKLISPPDAVKPTVVVVSPSNENQGVQISPFQEAQILRQREAAQNVLAALLELQEVLEGLKVELWAESEMLDALSHAKKGDDAYSEQSFEEAELNYLASLEVLQSIEANSLATFNFQMDAGHSAILNGNAEEAEQAFTIANYINAESQEAAAGLSRAKVLSDVLALLEPGFTLHDDNRFEEAREIYQQAQAIDSEHIATRDALAKVLNDILDRDFSNFMSQGYAHIQTDSPELAGNAFRQALALKPNSEQALAALEQSSDQVTYNAINLHLDAAQNHADAERWQEALSEYENALLVDPNVVAALEGRASSNSRNNLDQFLQSTIEAPLRLAESSVYEQVSRIYIDANNLPEHGPRLTEQLQTVRALLEKATLALEVSFQSNGLTNVTIARVSSLGLFTSQTLSLKPGSYIATGVRDGFRDVREEFIVPFDGQPPLITIQCDEAI